MLTFDLAWAIAAAVFLAGPLMWFFARRRATCVGDFEHIT